MSRCRPPSMVMTWPGDRRRIASSDHRPADLLAATARRPAASFVHRPELLLGLVAAPEHEARRDAVDARLRPQAHGQHARGVVQRELADGVGEEIGRHARHLLVEHVDDAVLLRAQPVEGAREQDRRQRVDAQVLVPQGRAQGGDRVLLEDRGAVDEQRGVREIGDALLGQRGRRPPDRSGPRHRAGTRRRRPSPRPPGSAPPPATCCSGRAISQPSPARCVAIALPMRRAEPVMRAALVPIPILLRRLGRRQAI